MKKGINNKFTLKRSILIVQRRNKFEDLFCESDMGMKYFKLEKA